MAASARAELKAIEALPAAARRAFRAEVLRGLEEMGRCGPLVLDRGAYFTKAAKPAPGDDKDGRLP